MHESSLLHVHDCETVFHFINYEYLRKLRMSVDLDPTAEIFRDCAKFQGILAWFTDDLYKSTSRVKSLPLFKLTTIGVDERTRIHRAFYRIETYCNPFRIRRDEGIIFH